MLSWSDGSTFLATNQQQSDMNHTFYNWLELPYGDPSYQVYGDILFFRDGSVRLGGKHFSKGSAIHPYVFGSNCVARRRIDELLRLRVDYPDDSVMHFKYVPSRRYWMQRAELIDPRLHQDAERFGDTTALFLYNLRNTAQAAWDRFVSILIVLAALGAISACCEYFD